MLGFFDIRNKRYADLREDSLLNGNDFDNFKRWPYTCIKGRILAELASILVYILQFTPIHANHITFFYAFSGIAGACLLASQNTQFIFIGVVIFFFKNLPDWVDGFLARLKNQTSEEGKILDPWGALVNSHAFIIGFGLYVFNATSQILYLYILIFIMFLRAIDLRNYMFIQFMNRIINNDIKIRVEKTSNLTDPKKLPITSKNIASSISKGSMLTIISKFALNFLDDRSRSVDFVCLVIVIEVFYSSLFITHFLMFAYLVKYVLIFLGGIFIVYLKKTPTKLHKSLIEKNIKQI